MTVTPSSASAPHDFQWLEYMSRFPHDGPRSSAGIEYLPAAAGGFAAALSSPMSVKMAPRDVFGHVKIPMVEVYEASDDVQADANGWYAVNDLQDDKDAIRYSSIAGLPMTSQDGLSQRANYSVTIDTSYMYTTCTVSHTTGADLGDWVKVRNKTITSGMSFYNEMTLVMGFNNIHNMYSDTPLEMFFTSWTSKAITNATCSFNMSYVQADVACYGSECEAVRLRPIERPANVTVLTVLDGLGPDNTRHLGIPPTPAFFTSFVQASLTYWEPDWGTKQYSTPIEYYFTNPGSPYSARMIEPAGWRGADIYPIGDVLFSRRMTQLVNTFWIASITPATVGAGLTFNKTLATDTEPDLSSPSVLVGNAVGSVTPDAPVMRPDPAWLAVLLASSGVMLAAAVAAAALGMLREGPDVLDRATSFLAYEQRAGGLVRAESAADAEAWKRQLVRLGTGGPGEPKGWAKVSQ